ADDQVDEVTAGHDAVEADAQDPGHHHEREVLHQPLPPRMRRVWSNSSATMRMNAAATSRPTKKLISAMVPDELTAPGVVPRGGRLYRSGGPIAPAVTPIAANPPAPTSSTTSVRSTGLNRLKTRNSP